MRNPFPFFCLISAILMIGCGGVDIKVDDDGVRVKAPGVDIDVRDDDSVKIEAPGVDITVDEKEGVEVDAGDTKVDVDDQGAAENVSEDDASNDDNGK